MEDQNYTIKDIAQMAGVSAGTVDRVLHNRGDVSQKSKEKVQKVLDEINYQPNVFAIGLAAKKKYTITCMIPYYVEHDYWHSVATGIERARQELRPFNVSVDYLHYKHGDRKSYQDACQKIEKSNCGLHFKYRRMIPAVQNHLCRRICRNRHTSGQFLLRYLRSIHLEPFLITKNSRRQISTDPITAFQEYRR